MEIKLHANATTTPRVRRYIQQSDKSDRVLAQELGISVATVRRWRQRESVTDKNTAPKTVHKALNQAQSNLINYLRQKLLIPLDELVVMVNAGMQQRVSRAGLDRYLRRAELAHMNVLGSKTLRGKKALKARISPGKLCLFYQRINLLQQDGGEYHILWAQEEVSGWIAARAYAGASPALVVHWLEALKEHAPGNIQSIETENKKLFGNALSPDHPLQLWCARHDLALTLRPEETTDVTLRVECALSDILPALTSSTGLDDYLQQICAAYNTQWKQKKLNGMTPAAFWSGFTPAPNAQ